MTPLARLVRRRRRELGLSTSELALRLRCSRASVEQVERAYCMIKIDNALRWCEALEVEPRALLYAAARSVRVR